MTEEVSIRAPPDPTPNELKLGLQRKMLFLHQDIPVSFFILTSSKANGIAFVTHLVGRFQYGKFVLIPDLTQVGRKKYEERKRDSSS